MVVLKGPKSVHLTQVDAKGEAAQYFFTSDGDIVLDSSGEKTVIRLQDNCIVRTKDVHLFSDYMTVTTSKETRDMEALHAWGRVRVRQLTATTGGERAKEGATLLGEWLSYLPETATRPRTMTLTGSPLAAVDAGRRQSTQEQILFYEKVDPDTGEKVQYQEMRGGKRGLRILIDDRGK